MWLRSPDCEQMVHSAWDTTMATDPNMVVWEKVKSCRDALRQWDKNGFGNVKRRIKEVDEAIGLKQQEVISETQHRRVQYLEQQLETLRSKEELLWMQRSKAHWLTERDQNSKFFHAQASMRRRQNTILRPDRGLCQGDPLSPYLFLFVAKVFSSMLQVANERRDMQGIAISRGAPRISHLLFTDDTIIFGKAIMEAMQTLVRVLDQEINLKKSSIVISRNINEEQQRRLAAILGVQDRLWSRIEGWNSKLLSQAGRVVLIKYVLQSIPTYLMSCFRMPDYVLEEVERTSANFLWHNRGEKRTHWLR
ncbi:hypothetical protein Sango_1873200 [Sesamum angolense]|uniref:Reverse transcriptase domain-containing protein n=1 Tax=Sesamum angolense TaxID=2727404 RepID=A0AAE2BQH4_9LAMI|nr:hypothetical protein Sango_1873200 [Sesamum angolense]